MDDIAKQGKFFPQGMAFYLKGWILILLALPSGCAAYHPVPLTPESVEAKLRQPAMADMKILASQIRHPILHPIELKPEAGLTPESAAVLAVLLNPSLRAVRDKRALANAQLTEAGLLPDPELSLSADKPTGGDTTGKVNAYGLGLSWDLTSLLSRGVRKSRAQLNRTAVDLDIAWQEWQIAQAAKAAVFQLAVLERQLLVAEQRSTQANDDLARMRKAVAAGYMTGNALNTARNTALHAEENLLDLKKQTLQQQLQVKRLLGLPAQNTIRLDENIRLPSRADLPDSSLLLKNLEERRLDLLALRRGYESQEEAVRTAIMEQFPRITLGPTFNRDTDRLQTIGFAVSIGLPFFNRNQGQIAQARATRQLLFDEYANRVFEAGSDVASLLAGLNFLNEQIDAAQNAETESRKLVGGYRAALADGRINLLEYQSAWKDYADNQARVLNLQGELARAEVALQLATGFYQLPKPESSTKDISARPTNEVSP